MTLSDIVPWAAQANEAVVHVLRTQPYWGPLLAGALAFCESLAIVSFFVPATALLVAIGALIAVGEISFWPFWAAAAVGAALGDWISYVVGFRLKDGIRSRWPFSRHPELMARAEAFILRFGIGAVFIGRFWGPLRAFVPLAAGVFALPLIPFQLANISSAAIWATIILTPGQLLTVFSHLR